MTRPLRQVCVVLPNSMAVRSVLDTPVQAAMRACPEIRWYLLTTNEADRERIHADGNLHWRCIYFPAGGARRGVRSLCYSITHRFFSIMRADFGNLVYRFNHINRFRGHVFKQRMTKSRKIREALAGNFVESKYGFPLPGSRILFKCLYRLYYAGWQCNNVNVEKFYARTEPSLTVLWHVQDAKSKAYALAARKRRVPILGVLGSWDRPTTKGPLPPCIDRYIVNSNIMRGELIKYHSIDPERIENTGWPQIDKLVAARVNLDRAAFIADHGLDPARSLLLYAANSSRLGAHEPSVVEYLVRQIETDGFSKPCSLLVRPHPQDSDWRARFGDFSGRRHVHVQPQQVGNIEYLSDLLHHTEIVIATQGSITLDAVAVDTRVVNIAFDGAITPHADESTTLWYEMDHFLPVVRSGGVAIARDFDQLRRAINAYLDNRDLHREQRHALRELELAPLDGQASLRTLEIMRKMASPPHTEPVAGAAEATV